MLNELMKQPGTIGYVVINFDGKAPLSHFNSTLGIPVKYFPEDSEKMPAVQYAALIADLVVKTK